MIVIDDPFEPTDPSDAALDRLLAQARWDVSVDADDRLRQRWVALSRKRRMVAPMYGILAAAAIALVVGTILLMRDHANLVVVAPVAQEPGDVKYLMIPAESGSSIPPVELRPEMQGSSARVAFIPPVYGRDLVDLPPVDNEIAQLIQRLNDMRLETRFAAAPALAETGYPDVSPRGVTFMDFRAIETDPGTGTIHSRLGARDHLSLPVLEQAPLTLKFTLPLAKVKQDEIQMSSFSLGFTP